MKRQFMFAVTVLFVSLIQLQGWGAPVLLKAGAIDPADRQLMARSASFVTPATNQCKFKLSYVQKTGALKGSCQIMTTSSQKFNAKINGVWINGRGWINATTKDKGCVGMLVE